MATPQEIQAVLEAKLTRLRQLEAAYLRAKKYKDSPEYQQKRDDVLGRFLDIIGKFRAKNPKDGIEATYSMGQLSQIGLELQEPFDAIFQYEGLKKEIESHYQSR